MLWLSFAVDFYLNYLFGAGELVAPASTYLSELLTIYFSINDVLDLFIEDTIVLLRLLLANGRFGLKRCYLFCKVLS